MNKQSRVTIIGGGIIGCSIALELSNQGFTNITVIERNTTIPGLNQSSTNEGSIHSGVYYPSDIMPLKAELCVTGNALMYEFLEKHNLPYQKVGKLIIAANPKEEEYLDFFLNIGLQNKVPGIKKITGEEAIKLEPNLKNITAALLAPSTGSTSPDALITKVKELAEKNGVAFKLGSQVTGITPLDGGFILEINNVGTTMTDILINSAGLYSDEIAKMVNPASPYVIEPARGEFYKFDKKKRPNIWMNGMHVYQPPYCYTVENGTVQMLDVPISTLRKRLKQGDVFVTAGVHLSPAYEEVNGKYVMSKTTVSPLKTVGLGKENYTDNTHPASDYIKKVQSFFPNLKEEDLTPDHTGIMCPLNPQRDFIIEKDKLHPNLINLIGMESPAWTSTFAIAQYVTSLLTTNI